MSVSKIPCTYSVQDLGEALGKSWQWIYRKVRSGEFPHLRVGAERRFTQAHIDEILKQLEQPIRPQRSIRPPLPPRRRKTAA